MGDNLSLWGVGGPPPRKLGNMKYSRSDSKPIGPILPNHSIIHSP